jgi:ribose transport system substrate-binding protein
MSTLLLSMLAIGVDASTRVYRIGLAMNNVTHPYRRAIIARAEAEAARLGNVKLIITDGRADSLKQLADVESLIAQRVDLVIMAPNQADALVPAAEDLKRAKIPLVVFDRTLASENYACFVGADNSEMGATMAQYIAKKLNGSGVVVHLEGTQGASATIERAAGFMREISKYPNIKVISQPADYRRHTALAVMENLIQSNPRIDAVACHNDEMALGAVEALRGARRLGQTIIVGMDGQKEAFEAIIAGEMTASIVYPTCFPETLHIALKILNGETVPKRFKLDAPLVDKTNVHAFYDPNSIL